MKVPSRFYLGALLLSLVLAVPCGAQVICSGDVPPPDTAITATGTSSICGGACRARRFEPVRGSTMIICAQQPIPANYTLESVTTSPSCRCLGEQDNAYVIRLNATGAAGVLAPPKSAAPIQSGTSPRSPSSGGVQQEPFQVGN